ncbi:MAG: HEAT repeat domain-containing protein [Planctomycetota bacterium]
MRTSRLLAVFLVLPVTVAPPRAHAQDAKPQRMTFKNNLLSGRVTTHRIKRVITRQSQRKDYVETLRYRQRAFWLQCNISEETPGRVMQYQMMVDAPAEVLYVKHGKKRVKPAPPPSDFSLSKGSTRLHSTNKTPCDAPAQVPLTDPAEKVVLQALLDFTHWQPTRIEAGHRWERNIEYPGFNGTQTFEFVDLVEIEGQVAARITLYVEGGFAGPLARDWVFEKGQAIFYWSRPERALVKMEAQADYQRRRAVSPDKFKLKLDVGLTGLDTLDEDEQELVKAQVKLFVRALEEHRLGHDRAAAQLCREFRGHWPDAMWLPAVEELEERTVSRQEPEERYSTQELKEVLVRSVITYDAARTNLEHDLLERTKLSLAHLVSEYRSKLDKLARSGDEGVRGRAIFALAFGDRPEDLRAVHRAAKDKSPLVRAMALAGLAARGSPDTDVELLLGLLDDEQKAVRRRACEAVAACVQPEHFSVVKLVEKLDHLMIYDKSDSVRLAAIRAIAAIGVPADIAKLRAALDHELNRDNRKAIEQAIEQLQRKMR